MSEQAGSCPMCGGEKGPGTTIFAVDLQFGIVVVRNVPAWVCSKCSSAWLDDSIAAKLEEVVEEARQKHSVVEVTQWDQVA